MANVELFRLSFFRVGSGCGSTGRFCRSRFLTGDQFVPKIDSTNQNFCTSDYTILTTINRFKMYSSCWFNLLPVKWMVKLLNPINQTGLKAGQSIPQIIYI